MRNEGVWFLEERNPPATGLRPAALPPLARGAFGYKPVCLHFKGPLAKGDWHLPSK